MFCTLDLCLAPSMQFVPSTKLTNWTLTSKTICWMPWEGGVITLDKFAKLKDIRSPSSIIATTNPHNNRWAEPPAMRTNIMRYQLNELNLAGFTYGLNAKATTEWRLKQSRYSRFWPVTHTWGCVTCCLYYSVECKDVDKRNII